MKKIVIIGGGAAGAKAASKAKRLDPSNYVEIFTKGNYTSVSMCGLPYFIEGSVKDINDLIIRTPEKFIENGIPVYLNFSLEEIYPERNLAKIDGKLILYDELILATGARVKIPNIENVNCNCVFTLHSIEDAIKIKDKMKESSSVLIVGGGYIALELAQAFVKNNIHVNIVEHNKFLLHDFDEEFSLQIQDSVLNYKKGAVDLFLGEKIIGFDVDDENNFTCAKTESGKVISADFCILSTGILPNVEIAKKSGIKTGETGAIYVDNKMRTNIPNIYAAGDCAEKYFITTKKPVYIGLGSVANKEGRTAAINASGNGLFEDFDGILASSVTGYFDCTISKTGLTQKDAIKISKEINLEPVSATVIKKDKAGYMPDSSNMTIKIVADKRSGELLGAQGVGCANILSRINTITSLLKTRATVEDLFNLDLPYAPPFSGSVDILLTAAYQLKDLLAK